MSHQRRVAFAGKLHWRFILWLRWSLTLIVFSWNLESKQKLTSGRWEKYRFAFSHSEFCRQRYQCFVVGGSLYSINCLDNEFLWQKGDQNFRQHPGCGFSEPGNHKQSKIPKVAEICFRSWFNLQFSFCRKVFCGCVECYSARLESNSLDRLLTSKDFGILTGVRFVARSYQTLQFSVWLRRKLELQLQVYEITQ